MDERCDGSMSFAKAYLWRSCRRSVSVSVFKREKLLQFECENPKMPCMQFYRYVFHTNLNHGMCLPVKNSLTCPLFSCGEFFANVPTLNQLL